jgi:hypothetical protein
MTILVLLHTVVLFRLRHQLKAWQKRETKI